MMNVFDYIDGYVENSSTGQYGDLLNNSKTNKIEQILDGKDLEMYHQLQAADKTRILTENSKLSQSAAKFVNPGTYTSVPGIGMVQQMC